MAIFNNRRIFFWQTGITPSMLFSELDSRDFIFFHAVGESPEIGLTSVYLENSQQRIAGVGDAEIFYERSFRNAFRPDLGIGNEFNLSIDPHDFATIVVIEIHFDFWIFFQLFTHRFDRLCLEVETGIIGIPHSQAPYPRLVAFCRGQVTGFILISKFCAIVKIHRYLSF
jgi:hypothetical protein